MSAPPPDLPHWDALLQPFHFSPNASCFVPLPVLTTVPIVPDNYPILQAPSSPPPFPTPSPSAPPVASPSSVTTLPLSPFSPAASEPDDFLHSFTYPGSPSPKDEPHHHLTPSLPPPISKSSISRPSSRRQTRRFRCCSCPSWFTRKYDMEKHALAVHEQVRPYVCDLCGQRFCQRHHMLRHRDNVHERKRPWACELCGQRFSRKEHRDNHCRAKHAGMQRKTCPYCAAQMGEKEQDGVMRHLVEVHRVPEDVAESLGRWDRSGPKARTRNNESEVAVAKDEGGEEDGEE